MINPKYISISPVIESIYNSAGYQQIDWNGALIYLQEVIGILRIPDYYVTKCTNSNEGQLEPIVITDYRGELPYDMIYPIACREYTYKIPMIESFDLFHLTQDLPTTNNTIVTSNTDFGDFADITETDLNDDAIRARFLNYLTIYDQEVYAGLSEGFYNNLLSFKGKLTYNYNGGYIQTNFESGKVEMVYQAIPIDDNGFPLIPDDERIKQAISAYIIERIDYKLMRQGKLAKDIYKMSLQDRHWKVPAAQLHAGIPSIDKMESFKNAMLRLNPKSNFHSDGFKSFNTPESLNI